MLRALCVLHPCQFRPSWLNVAAFLLLCATWVLALFIIKQLQPSYISAWAILIPGTRTTASFNIDSVGEASTQLQSPYTKYAPDPKVNYKIILLSDRVLDVAATRVGQTREEFGLPQVTLPNQTSIFAVSTKAHTPELTLKKAEVLYAVFIDEINSLRENERRVHEAGIADQLEQFELDEARALAAQRELRKSSVIISTSEYSTLLSLETTLLEQKLTSETELQHLESEFEHLQRSLDLTPAIAMFLIKLRQDALVQVLAEKYVNENTALIDLAAVLGGKHPKILHARLATHDVYRELNQRASSVIGQSADAILKHVIPDNDYVETHFYQTLVSLQSQIAGTRSEITAIDRELPRLKTAISQFASQARVLAAAEQAYQVATTVHATARTRLNLGKSDYFGSYPMTQPFIGAALPIKPSKLGKIAILASALIASAVLILFMLIIFFRRRYLNNRQSEIRVSSATDRPTVPKNLTPMSTVGAAKPAPQ